MGCFTCGKSFQNDEVSILNRYKEAWKKTGQDFWFFKVQGINEVNIATADDFKNYRAANAKLFKAKKVEFAHIQEFGAVESIEVLGDSSTD